MGARKIVTGHLNKEILLFKRYDPTNLLDLMKAKGVILFSGGYLSHPAIICREMSIPCVVIDTGKKKKLARSEKVILDGKKGLVILL